MRKPLISAQLEDEPQPLRGDPDASRSWPTWSARTTSSDVDVSIHPPFTDIRSVQTVIDADKLLFAVGAQHCHWEDKGAFTGEVSPLFLAKLDVQYVIVGHSERRAAVRRDRRDGRQEGRRRSSGTSMTPIVCVGETLDEREAGETETKVIGQIRRRRSASSTSRGSSALVVAYEPIWAIGTGTHGDGRRCPADVRRHPPQRRPRSPAPTRPTPCASSTAEA